MDSENGHGHSKLGIASFVISLCVGIAMLGAFLVAGLLHRALEDGRYPGQMLVGFAVIGLTFSSLTVLGTIGLMLVGLRVAGRL